jgi:hypothetical protein
MKREKRVKGGVMRKIGVVFLVVLLAFSACKKLDVVGNGSVKSFESVLDALKDNITFHEVGWELASPDNSARLMWGDGIIMLELDAKPFLDAGLDVSVFPYDVFEDKIMIYEELWLESPEPEETPLASYELIVRHRRDVIGYHANLDHYGITIKDGNLFEWAKDMSTNDKDIVFVLNPKPFLDADVVPTNIEGWLFTKVTVDDEKGKPVEVDKILKAFNLR